ncbi:hypothetical protein CSOJ01_02191, partial [Colletotrichum sojae]
FTCPSHFAKPHYWHHGRGYRSPRRRAEEHRVPSMPSTKGEMFNRYRTDAPPINEVLLTRKAQRNRVATASQPTWNASIRITRGPFQFQKAICEVLRASEDECFEAPGIAPVPGNSKMTPSSGAINLEAPFLTNPRWKTLPLRSSWRSLALPPYPYSCYLVDQVEVFMARDYHWFRWKEFRKRMDLTYKSPELPQSRDRLYLCRMLIVFALGETYVNYHAPTINLAATVGGVDDDILGMKDQPQQVEPPGGRFFDQALVLMKLPYEEPNVDHIEILNLATFYSYSLNRKKTAYMYAGASARTCNLLRLHQPPTTSSLPPAELEHRKRVCWTSFCLDKMTSSELGILPSFQPLQIKIGYPSDESLGPEDEGNFFEAEFLRARIQITMMKSEIDVFIDQWQSIRDDIPDIEKRARPILAKLESWTLELPAFMSFDCEEGMPEAMTQRPSMRSLSSHYLRCNQVSILPSKFGFWDSMHLFSSLMLVCLALAVNKRRPGSFDEKENDFMTYSTGKTVLGEMVQAGNLASKGHERMLLEIEQLAEVLSGIQAGGIEPLMEQWDVDAWMTQALGHDASMSALFFHDVEE